MGFLQNAFGGAEGGAGLGPWGALAGGILGGLFGGQPQMTPEQQWLFNFQKQNAQKLQDFSNSVPGSSPGEMAALAQQRGMLGEEQRGAQARLGNAMPFMAGNSNLGDLLSNLTSQQVGQRGALTAQMLQEALQRRQQALLQSSQVASGAYAPAAAPRQQQPDVGAALTQFAQMYAKNKAQNAGGGGGGVSAGSYGRQANPGMMNTPYNGGEAPGGYGGGGGTFAQAPGGPAGPMPGTGMYGAQGTEIASQAMGLPSQMTPPATGGGYDIGQFLQSQGQRSLDGSMPMDGAGDPGFSPPQFRGRMGGFAFPQQQWSPWG